MTCHRGGLQVAGRFRPIDEWLADAGCVEFSRWRGLVLRLSSAANNNDDMHVAAIFAEPDRAMALVAQQLDEALRHARWDEWLCASLPFVAQLECWRDGEQLLRRDVRPTVKVRGVLPVETRLVPVEGYRADAWSLEAPGVPDEALAESLAAGSDGATFELDRVDLGDPFSACEACSERPISPFYVEHGARFHDFVQDDPFLGPTDAWDGSVAWGQWVPEIALATSDEGPYAGWFADFLEDEGEDEDEDED